MSRCACGSMPPGTTILPVASMVRPACGACSSAPTKTIFSPWMPTLQLPTPWGATTCPPRITRSNMADASFSRNCSPELKEVVHSPQGERIEVPPWILVYRRTTYEFQRRPADARDLLLNSVVAEHPSLRARFLRFLLRRLGAT